MQTIKLAEALLRRKELNEKVEMTELRCETCLRLQCLHLSPLEIIL